MFNAESSIEPAQHPSDDVLQLLAIGKLGSQVAENAVAHLKLCPECLSRLNTIKLSADVLMAHYQGVAEPRPAECLVDGSSGSRETITGSSPLETGSFVEQVVPNERRSASAQVEAVLGIGATIRGFRLLSVLGEGGFGTVYRAEDCQLRRKVALKVLRARTLQLPGANERFLAEARALAAIQHDNVVQIYAVGSEGDHLFIAMPLLAGESLAARLERDGALTADEVRRIGAETAAGLAAIHAKGLIHRDLKPANIWLETETNRVKVLDLGLAKDAHTTNESSAGTPAYMSPEQAEGKDLDFRSDLFSLGSLLYECATGRRAFAKPSIHNTLRAIREEVLPVTSKLNPAIPGSLSGVIEFLLKKHPTERPDSAREVGELLRSHKIPSTANNRRFVWMATRVGVAGLIIVIGLLIWQFGKVRPTIPTAKPQVHAAAAAADLRIVAFEITHFARVEDGSKVENRGIFGKTTWAAKQRDLVTLDLALTRPAYTYLIAFRPDGVIELCYPENEQTKPPLTADARYPANPESRSKGYGLSESPGLWIFTAIVSKTPLPSFEEWQQQHPLPTQTQTTGSTGVILVDDGSTIDQLHPLGSARGIRGKGEEIPGQQALETIDDALKQAAPAASIRSIGIVAAPTQ